MPGLTTPWGGSTVQTTQTQTPPPAVAGMQGNLLNASSALLNPYLQPQNFTMAPMNADQTGAFDLTRVLAQNAFGAGGSTPSATSYYSGVTSTPQVAQQPAGQTGQQLSPEAAQAEYDRRLSAWQAATPNYQMAEPPRSLFAGLENRSSNRGMMASFGLGGGPLGQLIDNGARGTEVPANTSPVGSAATPSLPAVTNYREPGIQAPTFNVTAPNLTQMKGSDYAYSPQTVTPESIRALLNPYTQDVVDTNNATINRNAAQQQAALGARYAAAGAYGGSRQALGSAQLARSTGEQVANTTAQLMNQGWSQAAALAQANAQMQNQGGQFNAQMGYNAANQNNNNALQQYGLDINRYNSNRTLDQSAQQQQFARQLQAIQALLGVGNQQQQYYNQAVQMPLTYLQMLGQLTPQNYGGTTVGTQPNTAQSPLQTLLGVGTSLAGLALRR